MNLGENIYRLRTKKNMSQGDLADALGVSRQSVSKWENNSAVPELEKLIRMSDIFDITLDELVGKTISAREQAASNEESAPPIQQVIIHTNFRTLSFRKILGLLLICVGLIFLPLVLSATAYRPLCFCLILAVSFTLSGICVLIFRYPYVYCGWILLGAYTLFLFLLTHWEEQYIFLLLLGICMILQIWWTIKVHQKGLIHVPTWLWWGGGMILAALLILFFLNFVPPFWITFSEYTVTPN